MIDHIVSTKLVNCAYYRFRMIVHYLYVAQFAFYIQTGFLKVYFTIIDFGMLIKSVLVSLRRVILSEYCVRSNW